MIIEIFDKTGSEQNEVNVLTGFTCKPTQQIDYVKSFNRKTKAYNYGSTFDKWFTNITIESEIANINDILDAFNKNIDQVIIYTDEKELLFGAGIDYTLPIVCNVLGSSVERNQENIRTSQIKLSLQAIGYKNISTIDQLFYKTSVLSTMPFYALNYQTPIDVKVNKSNSKFVSEEYGDYGNIVLVNSSTDPVYDYIITLQFEQKESEAAQIEKFIFTNRSNPFLWSGLSEVYLFEGQVSENVMITNFVTQNVGLDFWRLTITLVTNV